eukprot:4503861-Amphidinium_carterae.1
MVMIQWPCSRPACTFSMRYSVGSDLVREAVAGGQHHINQPIDWQTKASQTPLLKPVNHMRAVQKIP